MNYGSCGSCWWDLTWVKKTSSNGGAAAAHSPSVCRHMFSNQVVLGPEPNQTKNDEMIALKKTSGTMGYQVGGSPLYDPRSQSAVLTAWGLWIPLSWQNAFTANRKQPCRLLSCFHAMCSSSSNRRKIAPARIVSTVSPEVKNACGVYVNLIWWL